MKALKQYEAGFTLLELMISVGIFTIVLLASVTMVIDQRKTYQTADQYLELQGKVRAALDILAGEIRMAGSGVNHPFATPIFYAFNDNATLGDYPTLSDLKDSTLGQNRSFGAIGFQYDRRVETRNDGTILRDTITNGDVMLIAMSSMKSSDTVFKTIKMETYTDEGTTQCSLVSSTAACSAAYVSSGTTPINLRGNANTELFDLNMYTITSSGANYSVNEIMDNVIAFDATYYLEVGDSGYTDTDTMATGTLAGTNQNTNNLGDNSNNDGDSTTDEQGELATITATTSTTCDSGGSSTILCSATEGILKVPLATRNSSTATVTSSTSLSPSTDIYDIDSASEVSLTSTPTINAGTVGDYVTIVNKGEYPITFKDDSILSGSGLSLKRTTATLSPNQSITFMYFTDSGGTTSWVETSPAVANIAAVKLTLTARSSKRDPRTKKYLIYQGTVTTKLRGYAL